MSGIQDLGTPDATGERILVVSPWGISGGYSGPLTLLDRLFGAIANDGARVDVIFRDRGVDTAPDWVHTALPIPSTQRFSRTDQIRWGIAARRLIRKIGSDYDAIHLHGFYLANQIAISGFRGHARVAALPVLDNGDLGSPTEHSRFNAKQWLLRRSVSRVDVALALSDRIAQDFAHLGIPRARVVRIGNPAEEQSLAVGAARTSRHDPVTVGFVGKVGGFKNPHLIIEALHIARSDGEQWRAIVAGPFANSSVESELLAQVRELDLSRHVEFTGYTTDVASALARMDVFVLPSSREGLPGALAEAMAAGLPCVVTDVGSMADHVNAAHGGVVVEQDALSVSAGIRAVTGPDWSAISRRAHEYAFTHFSPQSVAATYRTTVLSPQTIGAN